MSMDLRPLALGELLDRAFTVYRRHFRLFVGVMAVPSVLALALSLLVQILQRGRLVGVSPVPLEPGAPAPSAAMLAAFFGGFAIVFLAYVTVYMVALGATTLAVSDIYLGRTTTIAAAYGRMRGRVGRLILLMVLLSLRLAAVVVAGAILMTLLFALVVTRGSVSANILAALAVVVLAFGLSALLIFMMLRYGLAVPALVLEDVGAAEAIRRSVVLTKGHLGRVFVLGFLSTLVSYASILLFQGPFIVGVLLAGPQTARGFWLNIGAAVDPHHRACVAVLRHPHSARSVRPRPHDGDAQSDITAACTRTWVRSPGCSPLVRLQPLY
jgi:hypothetical protein